MFNNRMTPRGGGSPIWGPGGERWILNTEAA